MIISVASGKGGTGKTTVATSLAQVAGGEVQFADCDVEEPNAHLFLKPKIQQWSIVTIPVPRVDESKCTHCGRCAEVCEYNALAVLKDRVMVFENLCHGCGGCSLLCPEKAIDEVGREVGTVEVGRSRHIRFINGRLNIGEVLSPPVIRAVKAHIKPGTNGGTVIIDAPPGTSCPVIASVKGSDYCILVTEPTPFGLYDLDLAVEVLEKLSIPFGVVINRDGIGDGGVDSYCGRKGIPILLRIPFDSALSHLYSIGVTAADGKEEYRQVFQELLRTVGELT